MPRRGSTWVVTGTVVALVLIACGIVQAASDALTARGAASSTLVRAIPPSFGERVYRVIDAIAQPTFVEQSLALAALDRGDVALAEHYALRMGASPWRDEMFARIAQARGRDAIAYEYYLAAGDVDQVQQRIARIAQRDPRDAIAREVALEAYLDAQRVHPDAVADAIWREGVLRSNAGEHARASEAYERALAASPLNMTYLLSAANNALVEGRLDQAQALFTRALATIDPRSSDAFAGLGLVALHRGDRRSALDYAARARASDPSSADLAWLQRELR